MRVQGRVDVPASCTGFNDEAYRRGWTDGLPVMPPTTKLIQEFVAASGLPPDHLVAEVESRRGLATVEVIAANAVMAGCLPAHMPVVVAAVRAICRPEFNLSALQTTTNPVGVMLVVNGTVRDRVEMNSGRDLLGPASRANATIGRAVRLVQRNCGGAIPGEIDKATHGWPGKYTFCFAEAEEESPWAPLSVDQGYAPGEDVVTVVAAQGTNNVGPGLSVPHTVLRVIANGLASYGNNNFLLGGGNPAVILPPGHAKRFQNAGWSKKDVKEFVFEHSAVDVDRMVPIEELFHDARFNLSNGKAYCCADPDDLLIIVAGAPEPYHVTCVPNFGDSRCVSEPVGQQAA